MKGTDIEKMVAAPGELYSVTQNGPVASAEQIYDYLKEKSQEEINTELYELVGTPQEIDAYSKEEIDSKLNGINTHLNGLDDSKDTINENLTSLESTVSGIESGIRSALRQAQDNIQTVNDSVEDLKEDYVKRCTVKFTKVITDTASVILENISAGETSKVYYYKPGKTFIARAADQISGYYYTWDNYKLYQPGYKQNPYPEKVYICNGIAYIWDGSDLVAVGKNLEPDDTDPDDGEKTQPYVPIDLDDNTKLDDPGLDPTQAYILTKSINNTDYKVGDLKIYASPGKVTQVIETPMNEDEEYEEGKVYTKSRNYDTTTETWSEWVENEASELPETLQTFNSLYLNSDGSIKGYAIKAQTVETSQLSPELKNLISQIGEINNLKNELNILKNYTNSIDTKVDKVQQQQSQQNNSEETEQENNHVESFQVYNGELSTKNNTLTFKYSVQFNTETAPEYNVIFNFTEGGQYLTFKSHDTDKKEIVYDISSNTPKSQIYELEAKLIEDDNTNPSAWNYQHGTFTYTDNTSTYDANWSINLYVNSYTQDSLIQDTTFYIDAEISNEGVNIKSYSWSIDTSDSGLEIISGAKNSRCYFNIGETVTSQRSATITCTLVDEKNVTKTKSKIVSFVYKAQENPDYFLKIKNSGTNMENGYILGKYFSLDFTPYYFNTQDTNYGLEQWTIIKGPVMFAPGKGYDWFQLTDSAKGGDEIIIQLAPGKNKNNTDRITLYVVSGYNTPLESFTIEPRNASFEQAYVQMRVKTSPDIDNLKACTWEIVGNPGKAATINSSGLITISPTVEQWLTITVKATSLIDNTMSDFVPIRVKYNDTSTSSNTKPSYLKLCYNYGGQYIDFLAQAMMYNPSTGEDIGIKTLNTDLTWELVDSAVSDKQLQAACSNSEYPTIYKTIAMTQVPIEQVIPSQGTIVDQNNEEYQLDETVWYDYDEIKTMTIQPKTGDPVEIGTHFAGLTKSAIDPDTDLVDFRKSTYESNVMPEDPDAPIGTGPLHAPALGATSMPDIDSNYPNRVTLPLDDEYHDFILKCTYKKGEPEEISKTASYHFLAYTSYPYPPELNGQHFKVKTAEDHLAFDDTYPSQVNLRDYFEYDDQVLSSGAPGLQFEHSSEANCFLKENGILTFKNGVSTNNEQITVYQPYRFEEKSIHFDQPWYNQYKEYTIEIERKSVLETDFTINCQSKYTGTIEGAPLDGVTIVSKDSSNNVLSDVRYSVVGGSQYCSVNSTGTEMRIFGTGSVTIKGTLGNKVSYATFDVQLIK